ncbi:MAG TPA: hypothetical protein VEH48_01580 [Candidatus Nitrosopolaris sp.]|nr:hypothetical protein [Candidatus Nitrosopolaris sp.]
MEDQPPQQMPASPPLVPVEAKPPEPKRPARRWRRFKAWYADHKEWSIPATAVILLLIIAGVPWSRYHAAGLVLKKDFTVQISDSTANTPVSGALVSLGGSSGTTNGSGKVTLRSISVGSHTLVVTKKYYQDRHASVLVPILAQKTTPDITFVATGRQVLIKVTNLINGQLLGGVQIAVADTTAKTAADGTATVVLPANASSQKAQLSLDGYNDADVTVKISGQKIEQNDFKLTPAGSVYFLSTRSGQLDVMKANLDGSGAKTVVAASGYEEEGNTVLSQSPDDKYVALVSKRTASDAQPQLYVLAASDDQLLQADSGNAIFTIYGWIGDSLIYTSQRQDLPAWQQGLNRLKSYDATTGKTTLLDQSAGSDATADTNESYTLVMLTGNDVVYGKIWTSDSLVSVLDGRQSSLHVIGFDGQNHQQVATYPAADNVQFVPHGAAAVYISDELPDLSSTSYYDYNVGGVPKVVSLTGSQLYDNDLSYLFSPDGSKTFWSQPRDGKLALILGDSTGANQKTIQNLSDYSAAGWYTDNYLLLSKNGSELYISDLKAGNPIKVTDFEPGTFAL